MGAETSETIATSLGGNLAGYRPPWGNPLDVIPGADLVLGFLVFSPVFSLSVYIYIYTYMYTYTYMCPARTRSLTRRARRVPSKDPVSVQGTRLLKDLPLNGG